MTETLSEYLSKIPEHVRNEMERSGINVSDIIAYVYSDMAPDGVFADCWLFFDKSLLYVMTGFDSVKSKKGNKKILLLVLLLLGGLGDSMSNIFEKLGPDSGKDGFLLLTFFTAFVITIAIVILGKKKLCKADILFGLLVGVPNYFSARFLLASLGSLEAVIVYPTYSVGTMVVVTIVGVIAFREKISKQKGLALGLIAVAIALLNM